MALIILRRIFVLAAAGLGVSLVMPADPPRAGLDSWAVFGRSCCWPWNHRPGHRHPPKTTRRDFVGLLRHGAGHVPDLHRRPGLDALRPSPLSNTMYEAIQLVLGLVLCYVCISLFMQTKNDFRFIIPYVEFAAR